MNGKKPSYSVTEVRYLIDVSTSRKDMEHIKYVLFEEYARYQYREFRALANYYGEHLRKIAK